LGLIVLALLALTGSALWSDPPAEIPAVVLVGFLIAVAMTMADHVVVTETEVLNLRSMPVGSSRTDRQQVEAVGWARQPMGFVAPVLVLEDDDIVVLTALGRQTLGGPSRQAEELSETLGVACVGQMPGVGFRRRSSRVRS